MNESREQKWWQKAVIYEIYPKSFANDYGGEVTSCGTFKGIIARLPYLEGLGIDALWLCPVFESPFIDSGYDVSDYYRLNPMFGDEDDFDELVSAVHMRGMKLILDMVLNHTSDRHEWFQEALRDEASPYREYYIFRKGKGDGVPPNNWISSKTLKPTWTYNPKTDDYYMHAYTSGQPDLNWRHKGLRLEVIDILKYWASRDVDGFRLDVINKIAKTTGLPDYEPTPEHPYADHMYENQPGVHEWLKAMNESVKSDYPELLLMGQTAGVSIDQAMQYCHPDRNELDLYLQFEHMDMDRGYGGRRLPFSPKDFIASLKPWQQLVDEQVWPTVFFGSHDSPRAVNHFGMLPDNAITVDVCVEVLNEEAGAKAFIIDRAAKMLIGLQLSLAGTQIIYMGDELGILNRQYDSIDDFDDIRSHDIYRARMESGDSEEDILRDLSYFARDNARHPMPWACCKMQEGEKSSVLSFYKKMIAFRKSSQALTSGNIAWIDSEQNGAESVVVFQRCLEASELTVVANISYRPVPLPVDYSYGRVLISNISGSVGSQLEPYEFRVYG